MIFNRNQIVLKIGNVTVNVKLVNAQKQVEITFLFN